MQWGKRRKKANAIVSLPNELVKLTLVPQKGGGRNQDIASRGREGALFIVFYEKKERKKKKGR